MRLEQHRGVRLGKVQDRSQDRAGHDGRGIGGTGQQERNRRLLVADHRAVIRISAAQESRA
jgi:hypothetical protein